MLTTRSHVQGRTTTTTGAAPRGRRARTTIVPSPVRATAMAWLVLAASSCSSLTDVEAPDIVETADLNNATGAAALYAGALRTFAGAYAAGGQLSQILASGGLTDEFYGAFVLGDLRAVPEPSAAYPYAAIHRSRIASIIAIQALQQYAPTPAARIGELFDLKAYTEVFFAEDVCSGVPLGSVVDGRPLTGTPLTTAAMLQEALNNFDSALVYAAADNGTTPAAIAAASAVRNLAQVGRGRALIDLGRFPEAAAAVAAVPATGFAYRVLLPPSQTNGVHSVVTQIRLGSVSDNEGVNGLNFVTANDPRVPTRFLVANGAFRVIEFIPYGTAQAPVTLASSTEARLIEAEAALKAGNFATPGTGTLAILQGLRTSGGLNFSGSTTPVLLDPAPGATQTTDRENLFFRERAFWLFGTGHRLGDLRRLARPVARGGYGRSSSTVFPTGPYFTGSAPYGNDVSFTPDLAQLQNPAYTACQDRAP